VPAVPSQQRPAAPPRSTLRREIADGLLLVLRDPFLRQLSVFWAVANLALTGYAALLVVFLVRVIGLTPGVVGLLAAIPGIGGILGTWLGIRHALWILLGALTLSGTLLLTRALTGRRDLPGTVPGRRTGQVGHTASSSSGARCERAGTRTGSL
jgi:hypothetical protein